VTTAVVVVSVVVVVVAAVVASWVTMYINKYTQIVDHTVKVIADSAINLQYGIPFLGNVKLQYFYRAKLC